MPFSRRPANQRDKQRARKSKRQKHVGGLRHSLLPEYLEARYLMATYAWNQLTGAQSWNVATNWNPNSDFPRLIGDVANLHVNINGNQTISLGQAITVGNMTVGDTAGGSVQTIAAGGGNLTFDNAGSGVQLVMPNTATGSVTIAAPIVLNDDITIINNSASTFTLSGNVTTNGHTITINGSGPVVISGNQTLAGNTTYSTGSSGLVTIGAGTITTNDSNLTFNLNGTGGLTVSAPLVLGNSTVSFARLGNGPLVSNGAITVNGNVSIVDTSAVSRTLGAITNNGFRMQFSGNTPLTLGATVINGNHSITSNISVGNLTLGAITGPFSTTLNGTGNITAPGIIGPAGGLGVTVNATGVTTFSGNNTFDGPFLANPNSNVVSTVAGALGSSNSTTTIASGATLDLRANSIANRPLLISGSGVLGLGALVNNGTAASWVGNVNFTSDTVISPNTGALTISGPMTVNGNITDNGNSALTLSGAIVLTSNAEFSSNNSALFTLGGAGGITAINRNLTLSLNSTGPMTVVGGLSLGNNSVTYNRTGNGTLTTTSGAGTTGNVTFVNNTGQLRTLGALSHNGVGVTMLGNGPMTLGAITLLRNLTLTTNLPGNLTLGTVDMSIFDLTLNGTGNIAAGGIVSSAGAGCVTVNATGNTAFAAANTFTGPFQANSGATIIVSNSASLGGNTTPAVFANGSTLDVRVATFAGRAINISGPGALSRGAIVNNLGTATTLSSPVQYLGDTVVRANAGNITLSGFQTRGGNLTSDGDATVVVSGAGNITRNNVVYRSVGAGNLTVSGALDTLSRTVTFAHSGSGNMNVSAPVTLEFATVIFEREGTGNLSTLGTATLNGDVTYINNTGILRTLGAQTVAGAFPHNLTFNGNGSITTGAFALLPANLNVFNNLGPSNLLTLGTIANAGNSLTVTGNGPTTFGAITLTFGNQFVTNNSTGLLTLGAITQGTLSTTLNGAGDIFAGGIIGASTGAVTVNATGNTTFAAANTFQGAFVATAGRILVTANNGLGANMSTATFAPGTTLDLRAIVPAGRSLNIGGTGNGGLGALVNNGIGNAGWGGNVSFSSSTTIGGTSLGNMTLGGAITTGGSTITNNYAGPLRLTGAFNLVDDQTFVQNSASPMTIGGAIANQGKNLLFGGVGVGGVSLGTITLSIGPQIITNVSQSPLTLSTLNGAIFDTTLAGNSPILGNGVISGTPASLTLTNTAGVTLTAVNTYTGATTIQAGSSLMLTGTIGAGSDVLVQNGAVLAGNGTIAGNLTVAAGGNFTPGVNAPGQFVASRNGAANVVFQQGAIFNVQINGNAPVTGYDVLNLTGAGGTVVLGNSTLNITKDPGFMPVTGDKFFIVRSANNPVLPGQFVGLGNGTTFFIDNVNVRILYSGNVTTGNLTGGNDVVLEVLPPVLNVNDVVVNEGNGGMVDAVFTITMSRPIGSEVTVVYTTSGNTAFDTLDYVGQTGTLTLVPGDTVRNLTISVLGDTLNEASEIFHLNLSNPGNATIQDGQGNGTIIDDDPLSALTISDAALVFEGNTTTSNAVFTVNLSPVVGQVVKVAYTTINGTATTADLDYVPTSGTLTFAAGVTSQVIIVPINGDFKFEGNETFQVVLSNPDAALLGNTIGNGTIVNDDPVPTVSIGGTTVAEGNGTTIDAVFNLTLSNPSEQQITVVYTTGDLTATASDLDFQTTSGTITFDAGVTAQSVTVRVNGDTKFETDEQFQVTLSSPVNVSLGVVSGNATVMNDDLQPTVTIADRILAEGNSGTTNFLFNLALSNSSYQPVTVVFNTADGDATEADGDYQLTSGTITIAPGTTSQDITVLVTGETRYELNEAFQVQISSPGNATLVNSVGNATIINDDAVPSLTVNSISLSEGNGASAAAIFTVTLSPLSGQPATVVFTTNNGTATVADLDYVATSGTLTFDPGVTTQQITVMVNGDTKFEPNETVRVALSSPINATIGGANGNVTILNDDLVPTISIGNFSISEGNAGIAGGLFPVTLSNPSSSPITVVFGTSDGTALLADSDYQIANGTLTFSAGSTTQNITLRVTGETKYEANETFDLNLSSPGNATIGVSTATVTILNDDIAPTLSINDVTVVETDAGTVDAVFTVTMSAINGLPATVEYSTANVNAVAPADYLAVSGTLTFALGETSKTITVAVQSDLLNEANEIFQLNLSNSVNATLLDAQGNGTITNNDGSPSLSIDNVVVNEGNSGTTSAVFTVTLSPVSGQVVRVAYLTANVTAEVGDDDYQAASGTLTFAPGITVQQITVFVNGDTKYEIDETFQINLSNPVNALIGNGTGIGSIPNADLVPRINITQRTQDEGTGGATSFLFTVSLTNGSYQPITVAYVTGDGTATVADADYTATSGTLTFAPGTSARNITVAVNADTKLENHENFQVSLSSPGNATINSSAAIGSIMNDDAQPLIRVNDITVSEGNVGPTQAVFSISLSNPSIQPISVSYATDDGTGLLSDSDYAATSGSVSFAAGVTSQSVTVLINGDATYELDETFKLALSNAVNGSIAVPIGTGTIRNDDAPPSVNISDVTLTEGDSGTQNAIFTITLTGPRAEKATVAFATADITSTTDDDYVAKSGTLTFEVGESTQSVTVAVIGDHATELDESFQVNLSNPVNAAIADGTGVGNILNNDDYFWHNAAIPTDVNGDGFTSSIDLVLVVEALNNVGAGYLDDFPVPPSARVDVNRDDNLSAFDLLLLVEALNIDSPGLQASPSMTQMAPLSTSVEENASDSNFVAFAVALQSSTASSNSVTTLAKATVSNAQPPSNSTPETRLADSAFANYDDVESPRRLESAASPNRTALDAVLIDWNEEL